jgi:hypothetical protein
MASVETTLRFDRLDDAQWTPAGCAQSGWCRMTAFAARPLLGGVWASAPDDVWAGSADGPWHFDGARWTAFPLPHPETPRLGTELWGSGRDNIWMSTWNHLYHWDGHAWALQEPEPPILNPHLWGFRADDVWAANSGRLVHWNGSAWSDVAIPESTSIQVIRATRADDLWGLSTPDQHAPPALVHWDGTHWSPTPGQPEGEWQFPARAEQSLWGTGADDLWVIGRKGLLRHWDGRAWHPVETDTAADLQFIGGTSASDIWIAGAATEALFAPAGEENAPRVFLHWNGRRWTHEGAPPAGIAAVWRNRDGTAWGITGAGFVVRRDGTRWTSSLGENPRATVFSQIWGSAAGEVWAVGTLGTSAPDSAASPGARSVVVHWDGNHVASAVLAHAHVTRVWGSGTGEVWFAGDRPDGRGFLARWKDSRLKLFDVPHPVLGIGGSGPDDLWAVGKERLLLHWTGRQWSSTAPDADSARSDASGDEATFQDVSSLSSRDAWVVGNADGIPRLRHWNGVYWVTVEMSTWEQASAIQFGVLELRPNDVWVWGGTAAAGAVHGDGRRWVAWPVRGVSGPAPDDLWAIAPGQRPTHWDGTRWSEVQLETLEGVLLVWAAQPQELWIALTTGELRRWETGRAGKVAVSPVLPCPLMHPQ